VGVVEPSGKAFDAALGFGTIGDLRRDGGELGTLAAHDTADERGQRREVSGDTAGRFAPIALCENVMYGTIPAKVVTASIMASATPFCFCTTQKHLAVKMSIISMA
jgi:hypothetical protein